MQRCIAAVRTYENEDYKTVVEDAEWYQKSVTDATDRTTPPSRIAAIYHAGARVAHSTADLMETAAQWTASVWDGVTVNAVTETKTDLDPSVYRPIPAEQVTHRHVKLDRVVNKRLRERKLNLDPRCNLKYGRIVNAALHEFDADGDKKPLWDRLHLDDSEWAVANKAELQQVLDDHAEVFDYEKLKPPFTTPDGKPYEIGIDLLDDRPIVQRAWRLAPEKLKVLDSHINKLLAKGVIYPIDDAAYSAVTVLVKKPGQVDKETGLPALRVTTDYRKLNARVRRHAYMSSTAQEMFDSMEGSEIFTCIDIKDAFYSMAVKEEDQHKLAFSTPHRGMFTYKRMPQGFVNSPSALAAGFHKMLMTPFTGRQPSLEDAIAKGVPVDQRPRKVIGEPCLGNNCNQYVDDLIVFGLKEDHMEAVRFLLSLLKKHHLSICPEKAFIGRSEVQYVGIKLSKEGLRIDPSKVTALHEAPRPTDAKGVRRFLGAAGFSRQWIPHFSQNTIEMTNLLKNGVKFEWNSRHDKEYDYILKQMASERCLALFSWHRPVYLRTDASGIGYGATISQPTADGKKKRVVHYASKRLTETEGKRCARDLEVGALVWAVSKFRPYLLHNKQFFVEGDHAPIAWLNQYKGNNRRLYNYSLALSDYEFRWTYRKGETMYNEDWLSRHPGPLQPDDPHNPDKSFDPECGTDLVKNRIGEHSNCVPTSSLPTVAAIKPTCGTRRSPLSGNARIFVPDNSDRKDHKKESLQISAVPKKTNRGPPEEFHGDERSDARPRVPLKAQREAKEALDSPLFEPPYYGRDWPCICGNNCEPAGSQSEHGQQGFNCAQIHKLNAEGASDDWKETNPNTISPTATMVQPEAQYKVITLNEGIGIDAMALERNGKFKITRRFATTELQLSQLATDRDGIQTVNGLEAIETTLRAMPEDEKVHVLSCHTPPSTQEATSTTTTSPDEVLSLIPRLVEKLAPEVALVLRFPSRTCQSSWL